MIDKLVLQRNVTLEAVRNLENDPYCLVILLTSNMEFLLDIAISLNEIKDLLATRLPDQPLSYAAVDE